MIIISHTKNWLKKIVKPRSNSEDDKRREFILNVILLGSILLSGSVTLLTLFRSLAQGQFSTYMGSSAILELVILGIFLFLYFLSRLRLAKVASAILLLLYFFPVTLSLYSWGFDLPQGILIYSLIIVCAGILISSTFAYITTAICAFVVLAGCYLYKSGVISSASIWRQKDFEWADAIVFAVTFFIIAIVSWLSNREIEKSLKRAHQSEKQLKVERDLLEVKVEERTKEIKKIQLEKMEQLSHFAEIGGLASGIFHDLLNPLTAVSLILEKLKLSTNEMTGSKKNIEQAIRSTKHIERLMNSLRNQINLQEIQRPFSPSRVANEVLPILSYKAKLAKVQIRIIEPGEKIEIYGNPLKFHQSIANLISNAIDAYDKSKSVNKEVELRFRKNNHSVSIEVEDRGDGISGESEKMIFDPFFTTKRADEGMGLGLAITKSIIEKDFRGTISVNSKPNLGTTFIINIPVDNG